MPEEVKRSRRGKKGQAEGARKRPMCRNRRTGRKSVVSKERSVSEEERVRREDCTHRPMEGERQ